MSDELQYKRAYDRLKMSKSLATYIADDINERLVYRNEDGGTDYHIYANLILDAVDAYYQIGH